MASAPGGVSTEQGSIPAVVPTETTESLPVEGVAAASAAGEDAVETVLVDAGPSAPAQDAVDAGGASGEESEQLKLRKVVGDEAMATSLDPRCLWMAPMLSQQSPAQQWVHGSPRVTGFYYDVEHANHHPWYCAVPEGVPRVQGVETPTAVLSAMATCVYGRAFTDLVRHHAAVPAEDISFPPELRQHCESDEAAAISAPTWCTTQDTPTPPMVYGSVHAERMTQGVVGMARAAVKAVMADDEDGALVLSRPVGAVMRPGRAKGFAFENAVLHAVRAAREHGATRVSVVNVQTHAPVGTTQELWDDPAAQVISVHHDGGPEAFPFCAPGECADTHPDGRVVHVGFPFHDVSNMDLSAAMEHIVYPALRCFQPDLVLFVVGDTTRPDTAPGKVKMDITERGWLEALQGILPIQPRVVVLTDVLMRPTRAGNMAAALLHALQGRGVKRNEIATLRKQARAYLHSLLKEWQKTVPEGHVMRNAVTPFVATTSQANLAQDSRVMRNAKLALAEAQRASAAHDERMAKQQDSLYERRDHAGKADETAVGEGAGEDERGDAAGAHASQTEAVGAAEDTA